MDLMKSIKNFRLGRILAAIKSAMGPAPASAPHHPRVPPGSHQSPDQAHFVPREKVLMWMEDVDNYKRNQPVPVGKKSEKEVHVLMVLKVKETLYEFKMERPETERISEFNQKFRMKLKVIEEGKSSEEARSYYRSPNGRECESPTIPIFSPMPNTGFDYNMGVLFRSELFKDVMVGGKVFQIIRNPATIAIPRIAFDGACGTIMMPCLEQEDADKVKEYTWWIGKVSAMETPIVYRDKSGDLEMFGWRKVHTGRYFELLEEHVGLNLAVAADLGPTGVARAHKLLQEVHMPKNSNYIFLKRQELCSKETQDGTYRMVCYNVLAQLYNQRPPTEKRPAMYPYTSFAVYNHPTRYPLILRELKGYNADIFFLQEVDRKLYTVYLKPLLQDLGYGSRFMMKGKDESTQEGIVIAYKEKRFEFEWEERKWLPNYTLESRNEDIMKLLNKDMEFHTLFMGRNTCMLILVLKEIRTGKPVIAANTHLYFNPLHQHVKMLQAVVCARLIASVKKRVMESKKLNETDVRTLFGGDLNSTPESAVVEFFSTGSVAESNECWTASPAFGAFEMEQPAYTSLCGYPKYTNVTEHEVEGKTAGFNGCLDYLWGCPSVQLERVVPLPGDEQVTEYVALPSHTAPSDHLALVCEISFRN